MRILVVGMCLLILSCPSWASENRETVGIVKAVSGKVFLQLAGEAQSVEAVANMKLAAGDSVKTGSDGSAGLIFRDDTVISLGPNSEFAIEDFQFKPVKRELSFVGRMLRGTINYISGQVAKLAPEKVRLETPDATLGVRGTQILVEIR